MSVPAGTLIQRIPSRKSSGAGLNLLLLAAFHMSKEAERR